MKLKLSICLGLLLFGGFVSSATAEGQASLYFGRSGIDVVPIGSFSTYGGSVGVFAGPLGAELALEHSPIAGLDLGPLSLGSSMTNVMGNVLVQIPLGRFQPYGTVGYGALIGRAGIDPFFATGRTVGALNYGVGGKIFFTERVGLRLDWRRFAVRSGDAISEVRLPLLDLPLDLTPDISRFTAGMAVRF